MIITPSNIESFHSLNDNGLKFLQFMNALVHANCCHLGLLISDIQQSGRVCLETSGVDTQISVALPDIEIFSAPTCWKYVEKLPSLRDTIASQENIEKAIASTVGKRYASQLIKQGYGYRIATPQRLSDSEIAEWHKIFAPLTNNNFMLFGAVEIAEWANRYSRVSDRFWTLD
jgi:hypothetical protein